MPEVVFFLEASNASCESIAKRDAGGGEGKMVGGEGRMERGSTEAALRTHLLHCRRPSRSPTTVLHPSPILRRPILFTLFPHHFLTLLTSSGAGGVEVVGEGQNQFSENLILRVSRRIFFLESRGGSPTVKKG